MEDWLTLVELAAGFCVLLRLVLLVAALICALVIAILRHEYFLSLLGLLLLFLLLCFEFFFKK